MDTSLNSSLSEKGSKKSQPTANIEELCTRLEMLHQASSVPVSLFFNRVSQQCEQQLKDAVRMVLEQTKGEVKSVNYIGEEDSTDKKTAHNVDLFLDQCIEHKVFKDLEAEDPLETEAMGSEIRNSFVLSQHQIVKEYIDKTCEDCQLETTVPSQQELCEHKI